MNGFFLVDKPKGMTSFDVVHKIKKQFQLKRCGHNGTLDPNTTGLLIVACDKATKLLKFIQTDDKEYVATICFGFDTNTLDMDGEIIQDIPMNFSIEDLDNALATLKCRKTQLPPMVSAIKINGRKLYEYERKQIPIAVEERAIEIYDLKRLSGLRMVDQHLEFDLRIHCSKGFYVRSFARDIGKVLGGCAVLKELRRLSSGSYSVDNAIQLKDLNESNLKKIEDFFPHFTKLEVNAYISKLVKNGVTLDERQAILDSPFYVIYNQKPIAIYEPVEKNRYKPVLIYEEGEEEQ